MSVLRSPARGDLYVEIAVETPVNLSDRQIELLQEFVAAGGDQTHPKTSGFFEQVKGLWGDIK
jgi:molecular chaperone DnaJ